MTNSHIRQKAKELVASLEGRYRLVLLPLILNCYLILDNTFRLASERPATFFHSLLIFISEVSLLAISYNLLQVYRRRKDTLTVEDSLTTFASPYLFRFFLLRLTMGLLLYLWTLLGAVIVTLVTLLITSTGTVDLSEGIFLVVTVIILLPIVIYKTLSYSQAELLLCDKIEQGQKLSPFALLKESKALMQGHHWQFFRLQLSFIGWWLLMPITFGLIGLIVYPYISAVNAIFYQAIHSERQ